QFFPLQLLCCFTWAIDKPRSVKSFAVSQAAFSSACALVPSLFMQSSTPIDCRFPVPFKPSPACHPFSFVGKCWMICVSSTVKCHDVPAPPFFKYLACASALAPLDWLAVVWTVI